MAALCTWLQQMLATGYLLGLRTSVLRCFCGSGFVGQWLQNGSSSQGPSRIHWPKPLGGFCGWAGSWMLVVDLFRRSLIHEGPEEKRKTLWWDCTLDLDICILLTCSENWTKTCQAWEKPRHTSFPHKARALGLCWLQSDYINFKPKLSCHKPSAVFLQRSNNMMLNLQQTGSEINMAWCMWHFSNAYFIFQSSF